MTEQLSPERPAAPTPVTPTPVPSPTTPPAPRRFVVASVPTNHPYVRGIGAPGTWAGDAIRRLPDPLPDPGDPGRWWPHAVLDPAWIRANADRIDLVHTHFGAESLPTGRLAAALAEMRRLRIPLVHTVHDLSNPQLLDQRGHEADLDLLLAHAAAVVTLTPGAATEVARRWGRTARVIAHPAVLDPAGRTTVGAPPPAALVVGVHLRDLRPGIDGETAVATLVGAVRALRADGVDAVARVIVNDRVREPEVLERLRAVVADAADLVRTDGHAAARILVRPRVDDAELEREVADLDVALLPYRHGTHSGWVELCHDLGVPVVGPAVGYAHEQHPQEYVVAKDGPAALAEALTTAAARGTRPGTHARRTLVERRAQQRRADRPGIALAHHEVYAAAVDAARVGTRADAPFGDRA
ncbi:glycosyltransferase [Litorihabitans aurantiacus]|uniref:glycosyltransferase n=1 Tax=Litorihabitans aurantiacus TaxID=1930061 RepID=UPI0024E083D0|nr:glycosyltransferase [Litorihabitans aurantiacus]